MELELVPKWTIEETTLEDVEPATDMRLNSWLDTYVNDGFTANGDSRK